MKRLPKVAIVGRPNVGKSTLFNRITRARSAIVHAQPGVTRDIKRRDTEWTGVHFELIDTGGLFSGIDDDLVDQVEQRAMREALNADALIFVTDAQSGLLPGDTDVADRIREARKPVLLTVNKTEKLDTRHGSSEFFKLGFENIYEVSALHGEGVGDMLEDLVAVLPRLERENLAPDLRLAVVGMPNVGKSSLVNALVGSDATIVDERPGTTRDSIDIELIWHGHTVILVDTAGIKRKSRSKDGVTVLSALKSLESIKRCDVAVMMLDASRPISNQDVKVASYLHKAGKGVLVCYNKWDTVEKSDKTYREFEKKFRDRFAFMSYAPIMFISALTHQRLSKIFEVAWHIKEEREKRIATSELNRFIETLIQRNPPPHFGGGLGKIYYGTQVEITPPTFTLFVNKAKYFGRNYLRFFNNRIRDSFSFDGTLVRIKLIEKKGRSAPQ